MAFFERINERNKLSLNKPVNSDVVYYSELNEWFTSHAFRSFSIKFVLNQHIIYKMGGHEWRVQEQQYLVACPNVDTKAYFQNRNQTRSICIDICAATLSEVFTVVTDKAENFDNHLAHYFRTPYFFEHICPAKSTPLGSRLQSLANIVQSGNTPAIHKEWFMELSEHIIYQEYGNHLLLNQITSVKQATKKELLNRLQAAKDYMDEGFLDISGIPQIAEHCAMSEYHFYRRFKEVYKLTPNQYLTQKKLLLAKELLQKKEHTITHIATLCSYPDVFTFSKAFKRFFGVSPSSLR